DTQEAQCIPSMARLTREIVGGIATGSESGATPALTGGFRRNVDFGGPLISKSGGCCFPPPPPGGGLGEGAGFPPPPRHPPRPSLEVPVRIAVEGLRAASCAEIVRSAAEDPPGRGGLRIDGHAADGVLCHRVTRQWE